MVSNLSQISSTASWHGNFVVVLKAEFHWLNGMILVGLGYILFKCSYESGHQVYCFALYSSGAFLFSYYQCFKYLLFRVTSLNDRIHVGWCPDMSTREIYLNIYKTNMDIND